MIKIHLKESGKLGPWLEISIDGCSSDQKKEEFSWNECQKIIRSENWRVHAYAIMTGAAAPFEPTLTRALSKLAPFCKLFL